MSYCKSPKLRNFTWIILAGIFLALPGTTMFASGQDSNFERNSDEKMANAAADAFVVRYRKTLDVRAIMDEMKSSATVVGIRRTHFLENFGIDEKFADKLDDQTIYNIYTSVVNTLFMASLRNVFVSGDTDELPKDVEVAIRKSSVGKPDLDWYLTDKSEGRPLIMSQGELTEYLRLSKEITMLLRKDIPRDPFRSPIYIREFKDADKPLSLASSNYGEDFGLKKGSPVYFVRRDFFNLFFVKENKQMKLLFIGTGD